MVATTEKKPNKTVFVTAYLQKNQQATLKKVSEAWNAAGNTGKLSSTLVTGLRSKLGLTGNIRTRTRTAEAGSTASASTSAGSATRAETKHSVVKRSPGRPRKIATNGTLTAADTEKKTTTGNREHHIAEIERDFDRLIFKLMHVGGFDRLEDDLRAARRIVTRSHKA